MAKVRAIAVLKSAAAGYSNDKVAFLAAALAFSATFAMAPLLIIVIEIAAGFLGGNGHHTQVKNEILNDLRPAIGKSGADAIASIVQATFNKQSKGGLTQFVAWVVFLVAATGFFGAIQVALDEVWRTTEKPGFMTTVFLRLKSFAVIAGASIVLVAMVALTTVASTVGSHALSKALSVVIMLVVSTGLFAVLYKWLPRTPIGWKDVIGGSFVTAVLAVIGQYGIGMYLGRASTTSIYGAAGSLAAIMLWLYYTATIFLIGAELIKAYAENSKVS